MQRMQLARILPPHPKGPVGAVLDTEAASVAAEVGEEELAQEEPAEQQVHDRDGQQEQAEE